MKSELIISAVLLLLLVLLLNPMDFLMPTPIDMMLLVIFLLFFSLFALFMFRENPKDEREGLHRYIAARAAFLLGAAVLVIGIFLQSLSHNLDPWLVVALATMILGKMTGLLFGKMKY